MRILTMVVPGATVIVHPVHERTCNVGRAGRSLWLIVMTADVHTHVMPAFGTRWTLEHANEDASLT
jgi:hypothetical protein